VKAIVETVFMGFYKKCKAKVPQKTGIPSTIFYRFIQIKTGHCAAFF
jgi:hypothetical protein